MATEQSNLIRKRGSIKAQLTIFQKYTIDIKLRIDSNEILNEREICELESRIGRFSGLLDKFCDVQDEIECSSNTVDAEYTERENFETEFYNIKSEAEIILKRSSAVEVNIGTATNSSSDNASVVQENVPVGHGVRLPTIQLPEFTGDQDKWLEYYDLFNSLIHQNPIITKIQKFHYLRASLGGAALQVIGSLEFTETNYEIARKTLYDRYNNSKLLVRSHLKAVFDLAQLTKESSIKLRHMIDNVSKHIQILKSLNEPTEHWDTILIYILTAKLDSNTLCKWEEHKSNLDNPTFENFKVFLSNRADFLERVETECKQNVPKSTNLNSKQSRSFIAETQESQCPFCSESHIIANCKKFLELSVENRIDTIKRLKLCINCLRSGHFVRQCKSSSCRKCQGKHNTLLHIIKQSTSHIVVDSPANSQSTSCNSTSISSNSHVLLSTACVYIKSASGERIKCRALLDSASQSNFVTDELCNKLQLTRTSINLNILGINQLKSVATHRCETEVHSFRSAFSTKISCVILPQISNHSPGLIDVSKLQIPSNITLADPEFNKSGKIDLLIGAEHFWSLICVGQISLGPRMPVLQKSKFGWLISGILHNQVSNSPSTNQVCHLTLCNDDISKQLAKFWEIESVKLPESENSFHECENHFKSTVAREDDGRFKVRLPLKLSRTLLGDSRSLAIKRFYSLEKRLIANPELKEMYTTFMNEYRNLNHMSLIETPDTSLVTYYMPHHGVFKADSSTTRLRVVFDASAASDSGYSLNDIQHIGPTIQDDLLSILLRFRMHNYVITADVAKMYRQVLVDPEDRALQRIVWRDDPNSPIQDFGLNTVTYGTASGSFLAIRCLVKLAEENQERYLKACHAIKHDFYVDDLVTGSHSIEQLYSLAQQITGILEQGQFKLRKWCSNSHDFLQQLVPDGVQQSDTYFGSEESTKTLGLLWNHSDDQLSYKVQLSEFDGKITKRAILSHISQVFDPLGLVAPAIIIGKIILQKLWLEKVDWDESVSLRLATQWSKLKSELIIFSKMQIPRQVVSKDAVKIYLHGFSDASQLAYGACVYLRSIDEDNHVTVRLLTAKGRVAPLKSLTIPRLELCGALLLAQLIEMITKSIDITFETYYLWSDSNIVLCWLNMESHQLQTFVRNRVSQIRQITSGMKWRHVTTKENPADMITRGVYPNQLRTDHTWWRGPLWLSLPEENWPRMENQTLANIPEVRNDSHTFLTQQENNLLNFFENFSIYTRLNRSMAWVLRFINNCRKPENSRVYSNLAVTELRHAESKILAIVQEVSFSKEISNLKRGESVCNKSAILSLTPFLGEDGLLRVGGRISNAPYSFDKRHPIILSKGNHVTNLLMTHEHKKLLHAGPQLTLASFREKYWPVAGKNLAKKIVRQCTTCFRFNPISANPLMGNLPERRVSPSRAFDVVGVDYAGPILIREKKGRGSKTIKAYICLYICFAVKAIHLEVVTDLTSEAFIAAFRRFVSRRGKPVAVYSDNGTNFVGAKSELETLYHFLVENQSKIVDEFSIEHIEWHFIPANSPHFGGLWEAGVKSSKHHLKRVLKNALLTYEDLTTVLTQIEAILNSRPLCSLSSDPNDPFPLTPAHFLIGRSLTSLPDPDVRHIKENRLGKYQQIQSLQQDFWSRWSMEYISELQGRTKWKSQQRNIEEGTIVLIRTDNAPPMNWPLGRVVEVHKGIDGVVRVVSLKTKSGIIKRAVCKVCPLPSSNQETSSK